MKRAVVKNMLRTAALVTSGEEKRKESMKLAQDIAASNGYTVPPLSIQPIAFAFFGSRHGVSTLYVVSGHIFRLTIRLEHRCPSFFVT